MRTLNNNSIDFTLTDIPYDEVSRQMNGICNIDLNLGDANKLGFNLEDFLNEIYRITKNSICIFCGTEQFSLIHKYFSNKSGTTRAIIYEKTNPVPANGQYVYLSGIEVGIWFKKRGAKTFNAHCKNTVFRYPIFGGKKRIHPT
jgi:DNA modification methylase